MVEQSPAATGGTLVKRLLLVLNIIIVTIGNCGGPLTMRLYFLRGGKRVWFSSWLQTAGWPIMLVPLVVNYARRCRRNDRPKLVLIDRRVFYAASAIGVLQGADNYLYAYGVARLPVSTSSLIVATQLAFIAGFSYFIVRQRFTASSINAVVLLTVGAVVLGIHSGGDRPKGESNREYFLGFFMTLGAAAIYGVILPAVELMYAKAKAGMTYTLVMEIQLVMCFFATAFATVGMLINHDFQAIAKEAMTYELGATNYYQVIVWDVIIWQCYFLGVIGVIFYSSSLLSAIVITVLLPVTEVLAVIFFQEKFQAEKGIALFLSLWGFLSYFYGEHEKQKNNNISKDNNDDNNNNNCSNNHQTSGETQLTLRIEGS